MALSDMIPGVAAMKALAAGLAGATAAAALTVLFYEGVPLGHLRAVPILGPALETVLDGRVDRERRAGAASERLKWEEARRRLLADQAVKRREAQDAIDAATENYLEEKARREALTEANSALDAALKASEANDAANPDAHRGPAITRGVSRALDVVGR